MKVVGVLGTLALFIGGLYIGKAWWLKPVVSTRIIALLIFLSLIFFCYLVSAAIRSRRPMLRVGHLRPTGDASRDDCLFQMRVENLGPGSVRPIVNITYLRDGNGEFMPIAPAFLGQEVHWRYFTDTDHHKYLQEGEEAYAGVLWVREVDSDSPQLWLYPITLRPEPIWRQPIKLSDQTGLRLKIAIRCRAKDLSERETRVIKRSYKLKPDQSESLKYKAKRVRLRSIFWR